MPIKSAQNTLAPKPAHPMCNQVIVASGVRSRRQADETIHDGPGGQPPQLGVLCMLVLRGPQTPGELLITSE